MQDLYNRKKQVEQEILRKGRENQDFFRGVEECVFFRKILKFP